MTTTTAAVCVGKRRRQHATPPTASAPASTQRRLLRAIEITTTTTTTTTTTLTTNTIHNWTESLLAFCLCCCCCPTRHTHAHTYALYTHIGIALATCNSSGKSHRSTRSIRRAGASRGNRSASQAIEEPHWNVGIPTAIRAQHPQFQLRFLWQFNSISAAISAAIAAASESKLSTVGNNKFRFGFGLACASSEAVVAAAAAAPSHPVDSLQLQCPAQKCDLRPASVVGADSRLQQQRQ